MFRRGGRVLPLLLIAAVAQGGEGPKVALVNNQPFAIRMPVELRFAGRETATWTSAGDHAVQQGDGSVTFIADIGPSSAREIAVGHGKALTPKRRLTAEAFGSGVRVSFDGRIVGQMAFGVHLAAAPQPTPAQSARTTARADATDLPDPGALSLSTTTPTDAARPSRGEALPLVFTRTATGPVYEDWSGDGLKDGLRLRVRVRVHHDGVLDLATRLTNETRDQTTGVQASVHTYWAQPGIAERRVSYDNRLSTLGPEGTTPFRKGVGRHHYVQRGIDWAALRARSGVTVAWLNDFAESFTLYDDNLKNRFAQPRYTGANLPQLGVEAEATADGMTWITEIARTNIQSYRDRLIDNVLPPKGESVNFSSRLMFDTKAVPDSRATEMFLAYTGYRQQDIDAGNGNVRLSFGVPSVRFGTSYFPYSTLGENFDRLKLPGMDREGFWPLAADTVLKWPLFADAIRRDLRIAKAMGFHTIRLHYLDLIAGLPAEVQRDYLDFFFAELRHLRLKAMLSPSEPHFSPKQIAGMVERYKDVVESVELENEILIWGIPLDRPAYWNKVYDAVKAIAPSVPVHLTAHTNTGIFSRLTSLGVRFDRIGGHAYIDSLDAIPSARGFALAMGNYARKVGKPAVITEWNWRGLTRLTPEARAKVYPDIVGGALATRSVSEFFQFQFHETMTVNPRVGRVGIRHYEPLFLSRRPKPEAFVLMDLMEQYVAKDDPIRRFASSPAATTLDAQGRGVARLSVTNRGAATARLRARVESSPGLEATLDSPADHDVTLATGKSALLTVRLAATSEAPGFHHFFVRLESGDGALRYLWGEVRRPGRPDFDDAPIPGVSYPERIADVIDLDYNAPIVVVYGQDAPVLEMESAYVIAGTLETASGRPVALYQLGDLPPTLEPSNIILVGTARSFPLISEVNGASQERSFLRRVDPAAAGVARGGRDGMKTWLVVSGAESRDVEEAAMDFVLRYWRRATDSAARRVGLVEKVLPRGIDPVKIP